MKVVMAVILRFVWKYHTQYPVASTLLGLLAVGVLIWLGYRYFQSKGTKPTMQPMPANVQAAAPLSMAGAPAASPAAGTVQTAARFCGHCGRPLAADAKFCPGCGNKVEGTVQVHS